MPKAENTTRPNVVLIMVDQMRGDCIEDPIVETPNLNMMASRGVRFSKAYTSVPSCIPARAAMMTGLSQESHGRIGYQEGLPWRYPHTLAGCFSDAGYQTHCVGKMHVYPIRYRCGFDSVTLHDGYVGHGRKRYQEAREFWDITDDYTRWLRDRAGIDADVTETGLDANSWMARPWPYDEQLHPTTWVGTEAVDFLRRRDPSVPFFLKLSFVRPHAPLDPPRDFLDRYNPDSIPDPPVGDWAPEGPTEEGMAPDAFVGKLGQRSLRSARAAYYALITQIDYQIGRLMIAMGDHDLLDNTVFLFLSDHGELLGDHNLYRKYLPYEGSARVPFIVYDPGNHLDYTPGSTVDEVVELRDVMPSLLDFAAIAIPDDLDGRSVLPLMNGSGGSWREYLHGEHTMGSMSNHYLVSANEKYIWYSQTGQEQYFDMANDPNELRDLSNEPGYAARVAHWRNTLIAELRDREEGYSDGERLIVGKKPAVTLSSCP